MTCEEAAELIALQLDGELDTRQSMELEAHLASCPTCAALRAEQKNLSRAIRSQYPYQTTPDALRSKIRNATVKPGFSFGWIQLAATFSLGMIVGAAIFTAVLLSSPNRTSQMNQLVAEHVRSMMSTSLVEVTSSDQHTVKPWFQGKLSFSPFVVDLASQGFPLMGGRLDYFEGEPAAALVYHRNRHVISVFVTDKHLGDSSAFQEKGFNVRHFTLNGLEYWAVSDVNGAELDQFVSLFVQAGTPAK